MSAEADERNGEHEVNTTVGQESQALPHRYPVPTGHQPHVGLDQKS